MLKGLNALLNADLLFVLAGMGHGDELAIVDSNFPATSNAARLVRLTGHGTSTVAAAIFSVFPIDTYVEEPIVRMQVVENLEEIPLVQSEFLAIAERAEGRSFRMGGLPRFEFYERAKRAFAIVETGERRGYGNFLVSKGGVSAGPDAT